MVSLNTPVVQRFPLGDIIGMSTEQNTTLPESEELSKKCWNKIIMRVRQSLLLTDSGYGSHKMIPHLVAASACGSQFSVGAPPVKM